MADYWKSQPRKFCQYCKCWIADNKPSIEFHERGKNHKENVAAKISEIKKKSMDKAKQEKKMSKHFAAMEEAAQKAYEEDLKRMERESQGFSTPVKEPTSKPEPLVTTAAKAAPKAQPKKEQKKGWKSAKKPTQQPRAQVWVEGFTEDGHTYYYNTITAESRWEKPDEFQGGSSTFAQPESSSSCVWSEAVSPEGYTYYYNSKTGESSWEKPAEFVSSLTAESDKEEQQSEEPSEEQSEQPPGEEERSDETKKEVVTPDQSNQQSNVPKISFRKRKADPELMERERDEGLISDVPNEESVEMKEDNQSTTTEAEKKEESVMPAPTEPRRKRAANPYGAWEKIQPVKDPYASVDLQLPQVEGNSASAPAELPPEPKPKFKERVITSLGEEGGPASFRKTKTQNGKSRSLRQRDDSD